MYRAAVEAILGFDLNNGVLKLKPRIPRGWTGFELILRQKPRVLGTDGAVKVNGGEYRVVVSNESRRSGDAVHEDAVYELDGQTLKENEVKLPDDGKQHVIRIQL